MRKVYFISGLGATKRSFQFLDISFCEPVFVEWIPPLPKEDLPSYALRLRAGIKDEHPTIVGLSFGGMLAAEMALADPQVKAILISSNKNSTEFPAYLRVGRFLPLYRWLPDGLVKRSRYLLQWVLGARGAEQRAVQRKIIEETDMAFTAAAIDMILNWRTDSIAPNITHLHGSADRLLPLRKVKADHVIEGGTHLMVMNDAASVSSILRELIESE